MTDKRLILGLDASTKNVGWCLGSNRYTNDYRVVDTGFLRLVGKDAWDRIIYFGTWLDYFFSFMAHLSKESILVYERPTGNRGNMDTNLKLGGLMFCAIWISRHKGVEFVEVTASQVRKTGVYKGQLEKANQVGVKTFEVITKKDGSVNKAAMDRQDNEIDAIGVWLAGLEKLKGE